MLILGIKGLNASRQFRLVTPCGPCVTFNTLTLCTCGFLVFCYVMKFFLDPFRSHIMFHADVYMHCQISRQEEI